MARAQHGRSAGQQCLGGIIGRRQQGTPGVATGQRGRQYAANAAQFAAQRQLAEAFVLPQPFAADLTRGGQDTQRDRQIETAPSLGRSAGARLMVMRRLGNSKRLLRMAPRTRSLLSFTAASGRPTMNSPGRPADRCTSTLTGGASIPTWARVWTMARHGNPASCYGLPSSGLLDGGAGWQGSFALFWRNKGLR